MQYLGGKGKIAKPIIELIESLRGSRDFLEPFCGGLSITGGVSGARRASDICQPLITLYQAIQQGWEPPDTLSEVEYLELKEKKDPQDPLTGFAGFGCSFSGIYFGGYARSGARNYALNAKRSLLKKLDKCQDVVFSCQSYASWNPTNMMIYCDPPYANITTKPQHAYRGIEAWDADKFWKTVTDWSHPSRNNVVLISEYSAPNGFQPVLVIPTKTSIRTGIRTEGKRQPRAEKVFQRK